MRKRNHTVVIYVSDAELSQLQNFINTSGLSKQAYALKALLGKDISSRPCEHHPALLQALSDISNGVNRLEHVLRANGQLTESEITELKETINACWRHIWERF